MSGVYSKRFIGAHLATTSVSATVPAGKVWVVRTIAITCSVTAPSAQVDVFAPYPITLLQWLDATAQSVLTRLFDMNVALVAGERIQAQTFASTWDVTVSGYELTA